MQLNKNYFKVIQISDTHLFKKDADIFGMDSNLHFNIVLDQIKKNDLHDTDAIFLTGDLSQDESAESYQLLGKSIDLLNKPAYWIPGNHDCLDTMRSQLAYYKNLFYVRKLETKYREFIFLSTKLSNSPIGHLSGTELEALQAELKSTTHKKLAIIMHHHPMEVGTPMVDDSVLQNAKEFFSLLSNKRADLIICGHVHNDYNLKYKSIDIHCSPASCLQFTKGANTLSIDKYIGYKVYYFMEKNYDYKTKIWRI